MKHDRHRTNQGEIWAKLDAGTEERFHHVNGTRIPFRRVLDNIRGEAQRRPVVVQSLFFREAGVAPAREEIAARGAYADLLAARGDASRARSICDRLRTLFRGTALEREAMARCRHGRVAARPSDGAKQPRR